jgi:bifunctional DNase/RNase
MVEVEVAFISIEAGTGMPILFLKETEGSPKRMLPIWIGQPEAMSIQWKLKDESSPPRPMTHDLMKNIIERLDAKVSSVFVHSLVPALRDAGTFLGQINLEVKGKKLEIDSRPSDAIALALRFGAPIYVAEPILQENGFSENDLQEAEKQQSKGLLEDLDEDTLGRFTV